MTNLEKQIVSLLGLELGQNDTIEYEIWKGEKNGKYIKHQEKIAMIVNDSDEWNIDRPLKWITCLDENGDGYAHNEKELTLITPRITYLQVVRAKYEVEKIKTIQKRDWELIRDEFIDEHSNFILALLISWQGTSLAEQKQSLKDWIEEELK